MILPLTGSAAHQPAAAACFRGRQAPSLWHHYGHIVANPNMRNLGVCGPESPGHRVGETILALMEHGVDQRKRTLGTSAQTPYSSVAGCPVRLPVR